MHLITKERRAIVAATLTFALAACGTAGPSAGNAASVETYRGNPSRTGEMAGPGPSGQPAIAWQFDAGGPFANSPVVGGGTVFAASGEGSVHALDLGRASPDGRSSRLEGVRVAAPRRRPGHRPDEDGVVHALSVADGSPKWSVGTDGAITGSPATVGDDIVVATTGTHAYRIDTANGDQVWSVDVGDPTTRSVTVDDETAYLGLEGDLVAIALATAACDGASRSRPAATSAPQPSSVGSCTSGRASTATLKPRASPRSTRRAATSAGDMRARRAPRSTRRPWSTAAPSSSATTGCSSHSTRQPAGRSGRTTSG